MSTIRGIFTEIGNGTAPPVHLATMPSTRMSIWIELESRTVSRVGNHTQLLLPVVVKTTREEASSRAASPVTLGTPVVWTLGCATTTGKFPAVDAEPQPVASKTANAPTIRSLWIPAPLSRTDSRFACTEASSSGSTRPRLASS